jgi:hypothetical protein
MPVRRSRRRGSEAAYRQQHTMAFVTIMTSAGSGGVMMQPSIRTNLTIAIELHTDHY